MCPQPPLPPRHSPALDELLEQFEAAWRRGLAPSIQDVIASGQPEIAPCEQRWLLHELLMIDLWYRWRRAELLSADTERRPAGGRAAEPSGQLPPRPRLEDYLARFPALGPLDNLPIELIGEEYRTRASLGEPPGRNEYYERFPNRRTEIDLLFDQLSAEAGIAMANSCASTSKQPADAPTGGGPGTSKAKSFSFAAEPRRNLPGGGARRENEVQEQVPERLDQIGKYRVIGRIGTGGQAEVYRVAHPTLDKELVIKLSRASAALDRQATDRLVAEGKVLAELDHPNMARVYDLDFHAGRPFLVMEYVRGRQLRDAARHDRLPPSDAATILAQVADSLAAAHHQGVLHLDVKPENILLDAEGRPRLIDFGLARIGNAWIDPAKAAEGISGTVQYMSPEQAQGRVDAIDPRTDIFALGAVLYFLLSGRAPFASDDLLTSLGLARSCQFDRTALQRPDIPPALASICLKAMSPKPEDRYRTAAEMATHLRRCAARGKTRRGPLAALAAAALAALLWWSAVSLLPHTRHAPPTGKPAPTSDAESAARALLGRPARADFPLEIRVLGQPIPRDGALLLRAGQPVWFEVRSDRDCYLGVWHVDRQGVVTQLFPNRYDQDHFLAAAATRSIPGKIGYELLVTASAGPEYLHFLASTQNWPPLVGEAFGPKVAFATEEELKRWQEKLRGVVVQPRSERVVSELVAPIEVRAAEDKTPGR